MRRLARAVPLPLMAALLLIGAGWRIAEAGSNDTFSAALATAAMILLGAWIREYNPDIKVELTTTDEEDRDVSGTR